MDQDVDVKVVASEAGQESLFDKAKRNLTALELGPDWIRLLRWIQKGTSHDAARPALHCFLASEDRIESTDGFIIMRAKFDHPRLQIIPEGKWEIHNFMKNLVFLDKFEVLPYPDIEKIFPNIDPFEFAKSDLSKKLQELPKKYCQDIAFSVAFDGRYMKQIVYKPGVMRMYFGSRVPAFDLGEVEGSFGTVKLSAALMPMECFFDNYLAAIGPGQKFIFAESK